MKSWNYEARRQDVPFIVMVTFFGNYMEHASLLLLFPQIEWLSFANKYVLIMNLRRQHDQRGLIAYEHDEF